VLQLFDNDLNSPLFDIGAAHGIRFQAEMTDTVPNITVTRYFITIFSQRDLYVVNSFIVSL
jgi:hypothetical protein